ncbi:MAG: hypothetical protein LWX51_02910 [Deltaproteobacteria bacterium]|jgi:aspartate carbamoyltransferase regulatory subunit|nr:hypothetical protein [Deltaproteobacteria bacterium]
MKIQEILKQPEGKTLEFKRDISSLKPILKTLIAFANQQIDEKKLESLGLLVPHAAVIEHPRTDVPVSVPVKVIGKDGFWSNS